MGKYLYDEKGKYIGEIRDKKKDEFVGSLDGLDQFLYFFLIGLPLILIRHAYSNYILRKPISFKVLYDELLKNIDKKFKN